MIKNILKIIVPKRIVNTYHVLEARVAALRAGLPARKLLVIDSPTESAGEYR